VIAQDFKKKTNYTVLGASGFVGSHVVAELRRINADYYAPVRGDGDIFRRPLGHIIYCIGFTADWRTRPYETVHAHVAFLLTILERATFDSLLYLSSTRIYKRAGTGEEEQPLPFCPSVRDDLFDISKAMGESLCFSGPSNLRVARLSNVYGNDYCSDNFLPSVTRDAVRGRVVLESDPQSSKDYIGVDEVARLLLAIAAHGQQRLYNVASGRNTTHAEILDALAGATGCSVTTRPNAPLLQFPSISVDRIASEFGFKARPLVDAIGGLADSFSRNRKEWELK